MEALDPNSIKHIAAVLGVLLVSYGTASGVTLIWDLLYHAAKLKG
jgi:hypothetical protein